MPTVAASPPTPHRLLCSAALALATLGSAAAGQPPGSTAEPVERLPDPPPVHFLVPGFVTRELPLDLPNVNNLRYLPDGTLVAVAYDGDIYRLRDSDGDGLEDEARLYWDSAGRVRSPVGLDLTPPGYEHGDGVFVASLGKVSLITDTDGDGTADHERVIAEGWPPARQSVDAVGVAYDPRDGSVYFGLGTASYDNAYLLDDGGEAHFDIGGELGTVMRIEPDFSSREVVCTGVRFSIGMAFNAAGDLFVTDQEGATWMPNGNPYDELLHIRRGRHYGFPPAHPRHLPGLVDEPSTYDYGPQHQSVCGLFFNEPAAPGAPVFGPGWWRGDAVGIGESRGKIYRTKLAKTPHGYVAHTEVVAAVRGLAVDGAVAPDGGITLAVHSGDPDWGTGPTGRGKLYRVNYHASDVPQPVLAYPSAPGEVTVAFDRPLDPAALGGLAERAGLVSGDFVRPGDRHESFRPGYKVIDAQLAGPRWRLPVHSAGLTPDRGSLVLATSRLDEPTHVAVSLRLGGGSQERGGDGEGDGDEVEVGFATGGVAADWTGEGGVVWSGWLPHLDTTVSEVLTAPMASHSGIRELARGRGRLTLRGNLDLRDMLRPAVQPGSRIDFEYPDEVVELAFFSPTGAFTVTVDGETVSSTPGPTDHQARVRRRAPGGALVPVVVQLDHPGGGKSPGFHAAWTTQEDPHYRPLALRRVLPPWAAVRGDGGAGALAAAGATADPRLEGADRARGAALFHGKALCGKCHRVERTGGQIGPDLSNLVHRDYDSVLRDIANPSAAINPDFVSYAVSTSTGETLAGPVRNHGDGNASVGLADGSERTFPVAEITVGEPLPVSVMPPALQLTLEPDELRDLMGFLLVAPGQGATPSQETR